MSSSPAHCPRWKARARSPGRRTSGGFTDTFASRYVDAGELRLHAVICGKGPPLLLVHGWPETWDPRLYQLVRQPDRSASAPSRSPS
jgi:hypothetical protein